MAKKRKLDSKSQSGPTSTSAAEQEQRQQQQNEEEQQLQQQQQEEQEEEQIQFNGEEEEVEDLIEEDDDVVVEAEDPEVEQEEEVEEQDQNTENAPENLTNTSTTANPNGGVNEEEVVDDAEDSVQSLIEPFTKDQLVDLLREAAETHSDVLDRIRKLSDTDPVHRKIFVHGLGWDTNAEILTNVFSKYGEIEDCNAVCDKVTGKSKGYAFILFKHRSGARKALKEPQKRIGSRMTSCQLASAGPVSAPVQAPAPSSVSVSEYTQRKIYVSNVSADIDPQKLLSFFAKFGEIEEGPLGLDKQTGKPKGFALFVYKSVESSKKALEEPHKTFEGHVLHCQRAIDGPKPNKPYYNQHQHQHQHHSHGSGRASHYPRNESSNLGGGMGSHGTAAGGSGGHLMAQSAAPGMQYNQGASQALNPVLGQALTALLASQGGAGLGLTNLLGTLGSSGMGATGNQSVPPMMNNAMQGGYGNQPVGTGYGNQPGMQGGYSNSQMRQGSGARSHQGGGHMSGVNPYMGH